MVGTLTNEGWLVHHANAPISKSVKDEIKRNERRRQTWQTTSFPTDTP